MLKTVKSLQFPIYYNEWVLRCNFYFTFHLAINTIHKACYNHTVIDGKNLLRNKFYYYYTLGFRKKNYIIIKSPILY